MTTTTTTTPGVEDIEWPYLSPSPGLSAKSSSSKSGGVGGSSGGGGSGGWVPVIGPGQVLVCPRFLTAKDSDALIEYIEAVMAEPTRIDPKPTRRPGYAYRDNDRFSFHSPTFADMVWHKVGLAKMWDSLWTAPGGGLETVHKLSITSPGKTKNSPPRTRRTVGLSPNIRFYRYRSGQSFGAHYDDSIEDEQQRTKSEYTVLIYLNGDQSSDLVGGETVFYPSGQKKKRVAAASAAGAGSKRKGGGGGSATSKRAETHPAPAPSPAFASSSSSSASESFWYTDEDTGGIAVKPQQGLLLVHKHGDECMLHEAFGVQRGNKYVLRTDVLYEL
ncbi:hypothetical protein DFQ27_006705 [Actinomortierella ambigua]|uniref:Prolyl 4-hydroxylase alpha subunit domain-containing protein n=1 Tax=Actinomortierella ambigua TaxID=1343610 RepID=A0A9P6PYE4_9FUNG|nr:hypothetical protein DFQ27_006705 [Actinomortierella ambigua]